MKMRVLLGLGLSLLAAGQADAFMAYVSNEKSNTVSVIDTSKWAVVRTIKVGQRPRGIEITKDEKFVLVAVGDDDTIEIIDRRTNEVVGSLPSGPDPELFVQDAAGKLLYVANENDNTVTIIDIEKRERLGDVPVGVEPEGMAMSPDGKIVVATSETTNIAHFIDTATREIVANVLVDARPRYAEFKQDGSELWVSSEIGGTVSVIDPAKREIKTKIKFEIPGLLREMIQPVGVNLTRDGKTGFVALGPANRIAVVDGATHKVTRYLLVGQRVWHMAFTPDEKYLLSTNGLTNDVSVIDAFRRRADPFLWRAQGARQGLVCGEAGKLHRAAWAQRRGQEHAVLAGDAPLCDPGGAHPYLRRRRRTSTGRSAAPARRRIPAAHARSRSFGHAEPCLPRGAARHRRAGGARPGA
jgi:PQQ-dependent catabolism-associated beta-propeller protein